ncbi:carboxypeptidase B-like [Anticarsia gemmatalis]|uniref:carboxypeptidase B-like n=1 Tax=Anticarsia gemmatalis TaxID=129554 RepID=UPI003F777435
MKLWSLLLLCALAHAKHEIYNGWKTYYVEPTTNSHFEALSLGEQKYALDFLMRPMVGREGVVLVQPEHQENFINELDNLGIGYRVHCDNIKEQLDYEDKIHENHKRNSTARRNGKSLPYDDYQDLDTIYEYMDYIGKQYPEIAKVVEPAKSFEGRPLKYMKISTTNFQDTSKPVIVIDGGIHSREWISIPVVTWAIHKLVEDVTDRDMLEEFDWILIPVVNPDGYEFSRTRVRFWRMTRSTDQHPDSVRCPGVDGNRNYDFFWNTVGTWPSPCSDLYAGSRAFSEIETRVVRDVLHEYLDRIPLYLTMHSFGSAILYPWGHDGTLSHNALGLHTVGVAMADKIFEHTPPGFPRYIVGNSALTLNYRAAGASEDYAHSIGIPLSYTYELPGVFGLFHLDPIYIEAVCKETWEGIVVGATRARDLFRK